MHKHSIKISCKEDKALLRTADNFQNHIELAINNPDNSSEFSIKSHSVLNDLEFLNVK